MAFFELLASICKCFPVEKVENVRFQIDYLCGHWSEGQDATHNKKTFSVMLQNMLVLGVILMILLHLTCGGRGPLYR